MPRSARIALRSVAVAAILVFVVLLIAYARTSVPSYAQALPPSQILAADGSTIHEVRPDEYRQPLQPGELDQTTADAFMAAEDRTFDQHQGVSGRAVIRAALANFRSGDIEQGGSTLTMQWAKHILPPTEDRDFRRKMREALLALKLERTHDKNEILYGYLNTVYFGRGAYGVKAAAEAYFRQPLESLSVTQKATLAALPKQPGYFALENQRAQENPDAALDALWERRNYVLQGMAEMGRLDPGLADYENPSSYVMLPLGLAQKPSLTKSANPCFGHVAASAEEYVSRVLGGSSDLRRGGMTVRTTIIPSEQQAACDTLGSMFSRTSPPYAGLVAIDPATGGVTAMANSTAFIPGRQELNYAGKAQWQPGSVMKTVVLAEALGRGYSLGSRLPAPACYPVGDGCIRNYNGRDAGNPTLLEATARSINTAYVGLNDELGPESVVTLARNMGAADPFLPGDAAPPLAPVTSAALGPDPLSPFKLACIMSTPAADGTHRTCHFVTEIVTAEGGELPVAPVETTQPLAPDVAANLTHALQRVLESGGTAADNGIDRPAAGKTGTAQNSSSVSFAGYTPHRAAALMIGTDNPRSTLGSMTGGGLPAEGWEQFMRRIHQGVPVTGFDRPADSADSSGNSDSDAPVIIDPLAPGNEDFLRDFLEGSDPAPPEEQVQTEPVTPSPPEPAYPDEPAPIEEPAPAEEPLIIGEPDPIEDYVEPLPEEPSPQIQEDQPAEEYNRTRDETPIIIGEETL